MRGSILAKGAACHRCRKLKARCSGERPRCHRCNRLQQRCVYPGEEDERPGSPTADLLQARLIELEAITNKVLLSSRHNLLVISTGLRERIKLLGTVYEQPPPQSSFSMYPLSEEGRFNALASRPLESGRFVTGYPQKGDTLDTERSTAEDRLDSFQWVKGDELPLPMSLYLTGIFLPYRSHFNFFIPLRNFLRRLALPPSHSASIHPCLRNACHLAACSVIGGRWSYLEHYFAERTRHFLDEALMLAVPDHITQFLWASVILASYFTRVGRVEESFAVISPASHLGAACGLGSTHNPDVEDDYQPDEFLLPAPTTEDEAFERLLLSKSIFITDWSLNMLTGCPATFVCDDRWIPCLDKDEIIYTWFKPRLTGEKELVKMWQSDIHRTTSLTFLFVLVTTAANSIAKKQSIGDQKSLKSFIRFHDAIIPSFSEAVDNSNSTALLLHATLYGSSAIFHSLFAGKDARARSEMLRCVQMLVDLCSQLQRHQNTRMMQPSLVPMVHMMNALRILAHELRRPDVQENPTLSSEYCHSIEVLLDFLEGMIGFYPAWKNSLDLVKGTLASAMESLKI